MDIKKAYETVQKKYQLPSFEDLNKNFEISDIEEETFLLREIRKKIDDKVDTARCMLEEVLQPDTTLAGIYESRAFSDDEKGELFDLYRKLMKLHRQAFELLMKNDDVLDAAFICHVAHIWEKFKKDLSDKTQKLQKSWEKDIEDNEKVGYFG